MVKYYPYLRGKQYEFLALRTMCEELSAEQLSKVEPIIEPVRKCDSDSATLLALSAMLKSGMGFAYILNPISGDFEEKNEVFFSGDIKQTLLGSDGWVPSFILKGDAEWLSKQVDHLIEKNHFSEVLFVLPKNEDVSKWDVVINRKETKTVVCCDADSRSTMRHLRRFDKDIVRLDDC